VQGVPGFAIVLGKKERIFQCKGRSPSLSLDLYDQMRALSEGAGQWYTLIWWQFAHNYNVHPPPI
jgi:2-aminoethylphosphonate-pyruvate transaminase